MPPYWTAGFYHRWSLVVVPWIWSERRHIYRTVQSSYRHRKNIAMNLRDISEGKAPLVGAVYLPLAYPCDGTAGCEVGCPWSCKAACIRDGHNVGGFTAALWGVYSLHTRVHLIMQKRDRIIVRGCVE